MVERLKEQKRRSKDFETRSFGMPTGDGFTELVREVVNDKDSALELAMLSLLAMHALPSKKLGEHLEDLAKDAAVYRLPLQHLYWGIEIGRQIEREQREAEAKQSEATKVEP